MDLGSPDSMAILHPKYFRKAKKMGPITHFVLTATCIKVWLFRRPWWYFSVFPFSPTKVAWAW